MEGYIIESGHFHRNEYAWENGDLPKTDSHLVLTQKDFGGRVHKTIKDLIGDIEMNYIRVDGVKWYSKYVGCLTCHYFTNYKGISPTQEELDKYYKGEVTLWVHDVSIYITKVVKTLPTNEDLKKEGIEIYPL